MTEIYFWEFMLCLEIEGDIVMLLVMVVYMRKELDKRIIFWIRATWTARDDRKPRCSVCVTTILWSFCSSPTLTDISTDVCSVHYIYYQLMRRNFRIQSARWTNQLPIRGLMHDYSLIRSCRTEWVCVIRFQLINSQALYWLNLFNISPR